MMREPVALSEDERDRFWRYLVDVANVDESKIEELEKLEFTQATVKHLRTEAMAARVMALKLRRST